MKKNKFLIYNQMLPLNVNKKDLPTLKCSSGENDYETKILPQDTLPST